MKWCDVRVRLTPDVYEWLETQCRERQVPISQYVRGRIEQDYHRAIETGQPRLLRMPTFGCRHAHGFRLDETGKFLECEDCGVKL